MINETNILAIDTERQADSEEAVRQPDTSSTTTRAREEIELREGQLDRLMAYGKDGGLPATPAMRAYLRRLWDAGMSIRVLTAVMDETMMAPRPTWHYYAAIIRKLEAQGIKQYYQWAERQERFRAYRDADY